MINDAIEEDSPALYLDDESPTQNRARIYRNTVHPAIAG